MPDFKPYTKRQLDRTLQEIADHIYAPIGALRSAPGVPASRCLMRNALRGRNVFSRWVTSGASCSTAPGSASPGRCPPRPPGSKVVLLLDVNGEMCVFDDARRAGARADQRRLRPLTIAWAGPASACCPLAERAAGRRDRSKSGPTPAATTCSATCRNDGAIKRGRDRRSATRRCAPSTTTSRCCSTS